MAFTKKVNVRNSAAVIKEVSQMLEAYIDSLTEKGLHREAAYASKVFDSLNNIDF